MSIPRPSPAHHAESLSTLKSNPVVDPPKASYLPFPTQRPKTWAPRMNRQSALVFADFNKFESPRASRSYRDDQAGDDGHESDDATPRSSIENNRSSTISTYSLEKNLPEPPYHVFTLAQKKKLVYIVSLAGLFSPLSSNIYFPALGEIAKVSLISPGSWYG